MILRVGTETNTETNTETDTDTDTDTDAAASINMYTVWYHHLQGNVGHFELASPRASCGQGQGQGQHAVLRLASWVLGLGDPFESLNPYAI